MHKQKRDSNSSLANALRMLKSFSGGADELGITELARQLGIAKSTTHRIASTLADGGMLEQNPETGRYRLSALMSELSERMECNPGKPKKSRELQPAAGRGARVMTEFPLSSGDRSERLRSA